MIAGLLLLAVEPQACPKIEIEGMSAVSGTMLLTAIASSEPQNVEAILWEVAGAKIVKEDYWNAAIEAPKGTKVIAKVELAGMTPESCDPTATQTFTMP